MPRTETKRARTRNLTIMFTDIKGFTARVSEGSREDLAQLRVAHDRLLKPVFKHFHGTIIKTIGDAFLVRFDSPTDAVLCGVTIQEVLRQHNAFVKDEKDLLHVRVAINTGDVDISENDVMGEPVNIAARVEAIAEPGEVFFTEAVYLAMNRKEAPSAEVGEHTFKGIPYPVRVYKVAAPEDSELKKRLNEGVKLTDAGPLIRGLEPATARAARRAPVAIGIALALLVAVLFFALSPSEAQRTKAQAEEALASNDPTAALASLDVILSKDPDHPDLKPLALKAARMHVDHLRETVGYTKTLNWLREQLKAKTYLESMRKQEAILEAQQLASTFIDTNKDPWPPVRELANQDIDDYEIPLAAARILEGKVYPAGPLNIYELALKRGYKDSDERIFNYCTRLFQYHHPNAGVRAAHRILKEHFPDKGLAWAQNAFATSESGMVLRNANHILEQVNDPILKDPWHSAVYNMLGGFKDEQAADQALDYFKAEQDDARRNRLIAVHRWLVYRPSGISWGYTHKELIERNLKALETAWNIEPVKPTED